MESRHGSIALDHDAAHTPVASRRRRPPRALGAGLLFLFLGIAALCATQLDLGAAGTALSGADPEMLAAALALYALGQTISGAMWAVCQSSGGVRGVPLGTALGMHWISRAACELMPASLGEAVRVGVVRRHPAGAAAGGWRIIGGVAGYKIVDAAVTGAAVLVIAMAVPLPGPAGSLRWTAVATVIALAGGAIAWRMGAGRRMLGLLPHRVRGAARGVGEGAGVLSDGPGARTAAMLGLLALTARLLSLAALLLALGAPPQAAALAFCVIVLAGAIPAAPGGAGTREVVLVPALALAYGLPTSTALAFSLAVQAVALTTSLVLGAAALAWLGPRMARPEPAPVADPILVEAPADA